MWIFQNFFKFLKQFLNFFLHLLRNFLEWITWSNWIELNRNEPKPFNWYPFFRMSPIGKCESNYSRKKCPERFSSERKEALGGGVSAGKSGQPIRCNAFPAENPTPAETRQMHAAVTGGTKTFQFRPFLSFLNLEMI